MATEDDAEGVADWVRRLEARLTLIWDTSGTQAEQFLLGLVSILHANVEMQLLGFPGVAQHRRSVAVTATGSAVAVAVRHAQDVEVGSAVREFYVSLEVRLAQPAETAVCFDGVIDVPSGRITFGDADRQDALDVVPGRWRVQVALDPEDYPEHVQIWITSVG